LKVRRRQKEEAMYIEDTERLVTEIEMLKVVLRFVVPLGFGLFDFRLEEMKVRQVIFLNRRQMSMLLYRFKH
jgi:hypothetical protein